MRRGGILPLISYILYTLFWVAMTLLLHFGILTQEDAWQLGTALFLVVIFEGYTIVMALGCLLLVILKLLHMSKGWIACGIICLLVDLRLAYVFLLSLISAIAIYIYVMPGVIVVLLIPLALSIASLISNIRSLRN